MAKGKVKECDDLWKAKVKERAGGKCEKCGKDKYVQAHHILPRTYWGARFDLENGVALCRSCHILNKDSAHKDALGFSKWIATKRDVDYLESIRHRQSKNDYNLIKIYLESL